MSKPSHRGFTLIEVMVALAILLVAMIGMLHMHVIGVTSNGAARMHTQAAELAQELAQGLERLDPANTLIAPSATGSTPPTTFGGLVGPDGTIDYTSATAWVDGAVPGVRSSAEIPTGYQRHWKVWGYVPASAPAATNPGALLIAVSVIWNERAIARPREVVRYSYVPVPATLLTSILANQ